MSKFISNNINQIITTTNANDEIKKKYQSQCSDENKLIIKYFIYEINSIVDGEKSNYRLNIDKIYCNKKLISETHELINI